VAVEHLLAPASQRDGMAARLGSRYLRSHSGNDRQTQRRREPDSHQHLGVRGAGMAQRVGQRFLDDPVGGQVDPWWQPLRLALDLELARLEPERRFIRQRLNELPHAPGDDDAWHATQP
jgi:hypothetical protein